MWLLKFLLFHPFLNFHYFYGSHHITAYKWFLRKNGMQNIILVKEESFVIPSMTVRSKMPQAWSHLCNTELWSAASTQFSCKRKGETCGNILPCSVCTVTSHNYVQCVVNWYFATVVEVLVFEGMMSVEHVDLQILFGGKSRPPISVQYFVVKRREC